MKGNAVLSQKIGADGHGVPPRVAPAQPTLLQHRDIGDAVLLCKEISRTEAVAPASDNDNVVFAPGIGASPHLLPITMSRQGVSRQGKY